MNFNPTFHVVWIYRRAAETLARGKNQGPSGPLFDTKNVMLRLKF
jgi:hypothetical protein